MNDRNDPGFRSLAACSLLGLALLAGCTAHHRPSLKPGTGDVAFRLSWEGQSDLDLMVQDPTGECISYFGRQAPSGGLLDIDCNGSYESTCDKPIENIFWPKSKAPAGDYLVWVQAHSIVPGGERLPLRLQLLHGKEVFWSQEGALQENDGVFGPFRYHFPGDEAATTFPGPVYPPPCGQYRFPVPTDGPQIGDVGLPPG
jgi:hypothetical protein